MFNYHSLIPWGSFRGRQEEEWGSFRGWDHFGVGIISGLGSFRGRFGDHFRVGDHFGVGIISGAVQISLSQSNRIEKSKILSYTTERPVTIYRIEIIWRRYKSSLKCLQSPHRQYGATQNRNHKLPIQSFCLSSSSLSSSVSGGSSLLHVRQTFDMSVLCLKLVRRSRCLAVAFFAPLLAETNFFWGKWSSFAMASRAELSGITFHFL